jgi:hypothetical protein
MKKRFEVKGLPYENELHKKPFFLSLESLSRISLSLKFGLLEWRDEKCELRSIGGLSIGVGVG